MLQRNKGSILIITVFIFLVVNIIAITCSALILSNTKYIRYDYKDICMEEACLSTIEIIYANTVFEIENQVEKSKDKYDFEGYLKENESDFQRKILNVKLKNLENVKCSLRKESDIRNEDKDYICYKITTNCKDQDFNKSIVATLKIKKNLKKNVNLKDENKDKGEDEEENLEKASDLVIVTNYLGG